MSGHRIRRKERKASNAPENLISFIMKYICANTAIVIAAAVSIMKKINPGLLESTGATLLLSIC